VALHLHLDHVGGVRPRLVRAEHERDVAGQLEPREQRRQPAIVRGGGVLGQERHVLALGELHHPVARAAVGELRRGYAVDARAVALGDLERAVGGAGVEDKQLDLALQALGADRAQHLVEVARSVEDGHGDRDVGRHQSSRILRTLMYAVLNARSGHVIFHEAVFSMYFATAR
jgi:hypothetical protein